MKKFTKLFSLLLIALNFTIACASQEAPANKADEKPAAALTAQSADEIGKYIRKAFNVPANVAIQVKEGGETSIPGLRSIQVQFTGERGSQTQDAWISMDGKTLVVGRVLDLTKDPNKVDLAKMDLNGAPVKGAADAKVTIVEYTDFQCPYCSRAHTTIEQLLKDYDGKIKVVYKSLPLAMHNWAQDSAVAATCVQEQNPEAFWKFADYFFKNQTSITKETLNDKVMTLAKENALDEAKLKSCIDSKQTLPRVQADMKEAQSLGFSSTPSFVVNGNMLIGAKPIEEFKQVIDEELAAASK